MVFLKIILALFQICLGNKVLDRIDNFKQMETKIKFLMYNRIYLMDCHPYNFTTLLFIKIKFQLLSYQL